MPPSSSPVKDAGLSIEFERFDQKMIAGNPGSNPGGGILKILLMPLPRLNL